jgi:naphthalene 1,2-dioxygenase ferredoxin component
MSNPNWIDVVAVADLTPDDVTGFDAGGIDLALYSVEGVVFATSNICTHGQARLCDGFLEGHEIECPLHQGRFDVRDGRALCLPATEGLHVFPVKVEGGRVFVEIV